MRQPPEFLGVQASRRSFSNGQEICGMGEPGEQWYRVDAGAARQISIARDGRRQIVDLLLVGDYFGFSVQTHYDFTVEAATGDTVISCFSRRSVEKLAESDPALACELLRITMASLARLQTTLMVLGRVTSTEKVASFLLNLSSRLSHEDCERLVLPVTRYDIADNLTLSVETVSRALTSLRQHCAIRMSESPSTIILNRRALERLLENRKSSSQSRRSAAPPRLSH
jgi:CRP/FNR family transcriptional regulator, nitrogen fixation regulation protein